MVLLAGEVLDYPFDFWSNPSLWPIELKMFDVSSKLTEVDWLHFLLWARDLFLELTEFLFLFHLNKLTLMVSELVFEDLVNNFMS
jgi:hypothetical protein